MKKILLILFIVPYSLLFSQSDSEIKFITKNYNFSKIEKIIKEAQVQYAKQQNEILKFSKSNKIPLSIYKDGSFKQLIRIDNGTPIYYETFNRLAAKSTRANLLHANGALGLDIEGQNMTAYVWDGGRALSTHNEFTINNVSKITDGDSTPLPQNGDRNHATHVSGTIAARGSHANAKGMAPMANIVSYDWSNDYVEASIEIGNGMLLSNHSYGIGGGLTSSVPSWMYGAYSLESRRWDNLMYTAPYYLMVSAAGNSGSSNANNEPLDGVVGYDKLTEFGNSKNSMVVANANDLIVDSDGNILVAPVINSSSSQGPTDDYRIKPDITGNGTNVFSCIATGNNAYDTYTGTSMASPNVTGSLLLLQQLYHEHYGLFMRAASLKGLALHTADDAGAIGPDVIFGWGYMNTKTAANLILSNTSVINENELQDNEIVNFDVVSDGVNPLKISISWTDLPSNNVNFGTVNSTTPVLVNDLDLRIEKNGTTYLPWKLTGVTSNSTGDNTVDPFENIEIDNATGGVYHVTISHKGTLTNGPQKYSVIMSGISSTTLGQESNSLVNDYSVNFWPNPAQDILNVYSSEFGEYEFKIFSSIGTMVYNKKTKLDAESTNKLDLSLLSPGIYTIQTSHKNTITTNKLIIK